MLPSAREPSFKVRILLVHLGLLPGSGVIMPNCLWEYSKPVLEKKELFAWLVSDPTWPTLAMALEGQKLWAGCGSRDGLLKQRIFCHCPK